MNKSLDETDLAILILLQKDAKLTHKEIAHKIGKSITPVYDRIKRMEKEGIILQYVALLDKQKINQGLTVFTNIQLKEHAHDMLKSFEVQIIEFKEVMECHFMSGQFDFLLKIVVPDMQAFQTFMLNKIAKMDNIGTVQSFFSVFEIKNETAFALNS